MDRLVGLLEKYMPEGPPLFPEDALTDLPERFFAAEMIREKILLLVQEEVPYSTAVRVDSWEDKEGLTHIEASRLVERDSQKGVIIGKKGAKLKQIGQTSREAIERFLGTKVYLRLFVRVQKNWSRDTKALRKLGY